VEIFLQKSFAEVRAKETRGPGNENSFFCH
jgi:hypothetical protein